MDFKTAAEMSRYLMANATKTVTVENKMVRKNGVMVEVALSRVTYEIDGKIFRAADANSTTIIGHTKFVHRLIAA